MQLRTRRLNHPCRLAAMANQLQCCASCDSMPMRPPLHDLPDGAQTLLPPEKWLDLKDLLE